MEHFTLSKPGTNERCRATIVRRGTRLLLVVWTDGQGGGGHTGRPEKYGWDYSVTSRDANERAVTWETRFIQDRFTKVKFRDGEAFLPRNGCVILLRTRGERRELHQLKIDLAEYSADEAGLRKLGTHNDVVAFFTR